jgi:glycosyltransferase involved in cell wall biosynthesis
MRILYCISTLEIGGAERQLALITKGLVAYGWDVHLAVFKGGAFEAQLAPETTVHHIPRLGNYDPLIIARLVRLIRSIRPALVQTWLPQMDVLGGAAAILCGVPWVIAERCSVMNYPPGWKTKSREVIGKSALAVIANSQGGLDYWQTHHGRRALDRVIPNAISTGSYQAVEGRPAIPVIAFVGRLSPQKRIAELLRAVDLVRRELPVKVLICGDGPLRDELRADARSLGLGDVVSFTGFIDDIETVLRQASVFVSLSGFEGLPNAVQEAVICRTPVVLSDIPAHREMLDEQSALFVDANDPQSVAAALMATIRDPAAARERTCAAMRYAERWSPEGVIAAYGAFYRELLRAEEHR